MAENPRPIKKGKRLTTGDGAKAGSSSSVPILGPGLTQADLERAVGFSGGVLINTDLLQMPELPSFQHAPQFQILDSGLLSHASFLTSASDYRRKLREEGADKKGNKMGYFNLDGEKYAELLARQQKHLEGKKGFEWLTKLKEEMAKPSSSDEEDQDDEKDVKLPDFQNFQPLKIPVDRLSEIKKEKVEQELKPAEEESPKSTGSGASTAVVANAEETSGVEVKEDKEDLQGGGNEARALEFEEEEEDLTLIVEESVEDLFPH